MNRAIFNADLHNEQVLGDYLDQYLYPNVALQNLLRETNMNQQYVGIDVHFNVNNQAYLVDEKGYLTRPTIQNTFVLELSFINPRRQRVEGWFYNPDKVTTHYLFCWADRVDIDIRHERLNINHLHRVEVMLINRRVLQVYLNGQYNINRQYIHEHLGEILEATANGPLPLGNMRSKYMLSSQLPEQPLNIVMTKREYIASNAVEGRYMVYRDKIETLPY